MSVNNVNILSVKTNNNAINNGFVVHKVDDETLKNWALEKPFKEVNKVKNSVTKMVFVGIPIVDSMLSAASHNGNLAAKTTKGLSAMGKWGAAIVAATALIKAKKHASEKSELIKDFNNNHRTLSFVADFGIISAMYFGVLKGAKKLNTVINNKFERPLTTAKQTVEHVLNSTKLNKKVVEPLNKYFVSNQYKNKALKLVAIVAAPVMLVASLVRLNQETSRAIVDARNNYEYLKEVNSLLPDEPSTTKV